MIKRTYSDLIGNWMEDLVAEGRGAVVVGRTEEGDVGMWIRGDGICAGRGDSVFNAARTALMKEKELLPVEFLDLSVRAMNVIDGFNTDLGIRIARDLARMTEREFSNRKNCGRKVLCEVKAVLESLGLSFAPEPANNGGKA